MFPTHPDLAEEMSEVETERGDVARSHGNEGVAVSSGQSAGRNTQFSVCLGYALLRITILFSHNDQGHLSISIMPVHDQEAQAKQYADQSASCAVYAFLKRNRRSRQRLLSSPQDHPSSVRAKRRKRYRESVLLAISCCC